MKSLFLFLVAALVTNISNAQTFLSNDFYNNDTLRKSQSPYIVNKDLVIFQNVTLCVEPGTTILFNTHALTVRGNLIAEGTINDSIRFASQSSSKSKGLIIQQNDKTYPYQLYLKNCVAENFEDFISVDRTNYWMRGKFFFKHCVFRNNKNVFVNRPAFMDDITVDSCLFYKNSFCLKGNYDDDYDYYIVSNSKFIDNAIGVEGCHIDNCYFTGHTAYAVRYASITNSILYNNNIGLDGVADKHSLAENNEITYNNIGVNITWSDNLPTGNTFFKNNKICHNKTWNIQNSSIEDGNIWNTCWCSTDSVAIRKTIRDGYVDNQYGRLFFTYTDTCSASMSPPDTTLSVAQAVTTVRTSIFPNPATTTATLLFDFLPSHHYTVSVYDITGRRLVLLDNILSGTVHINISDFAPGVYIVSLYSGNRPVGKQKMMVQ